MSRTASDVIRVFQNGPCPRSAFWLRAYVEAGVALTLMRRPTIDEPLLKRFRAALDEIYGPRLERVVLGDGHIRRAAATSM
jgi:hypothetical protein